MKKRGSINTKLRLTVLFITLFAMLVIGIISIGFMYRIKDNSETTIIDEMQNSASLLVQEKIEEAELTLDHYVSYLDTEASLIELIHSKPENYVKRSIPKRSPDAPDIYLSQRSYVNEDVDKDAVEDEMSLLVNLESLWVPMMQQDGDTITTTYIGTETGFMISYDRYASLAEYSDDGEVYFNHPERNWYKKAKEGLDVVFTDLSQDYFGRGLSLTCAKPFFYYGVFAGVVAMDILIDDLKNTIIDIDVKEGYDSDYAFIVNENGDIIASPVINKDTTEFENIKDLNNKFYSISDSILSNKKGMDKVDDFYLIYSPIERANWVLCVYVPEEIIMQPIRQLEQRIKVVITIFVLIMLIVCSIAYFVVKIVSGKIIEPILLLKEDVGVISKGNLEHKARVIGNDEVSDLAQAFNDMTKSLKDYISDLTSLTAEKERIGAELNVATSIQSSMLPSIFPNFAGSDKFDIYATMNPAKEVGGDFYDFFMIDDKHIVIVVADVSGKGIPAALFMVIGKTLIKDHTGLKTNLSDVFYEVNNLLCESNSENLFITAFEAVINLETGHFTYVNAGHEMPYIYRKGKDWQPEQMKPGFVLAGMENMKFTTGELYLKPGDKVFQYTDGVTEATNAKNELYGMDRLKEALDANSDKKMFDLLPAVKADIDKFVGEAPQFDDITMLGFEFK